MRTTRFRAPQYRGQDYFFLHKKYIYVYCHNNPNAPHFSDDSDRSGKVGDDTIDTLDLNFQKYVVLYFINAFRPTFINEFELSFLSQLDISKYFIGHELKLSKGKMS